MILKQIEPHLLKHDLTVISGYRDKAFYARLYHKSGQFVESVMPVDEFGDPKCDAPDTFA